MGSQKKISWHRSWSKEKLAKAWSMGKNLKDWDHIIDWCKLHDVEPIEVFNWVASKRINKTDEKTIRIAVLISSSKSKLPLRAKAIHLRNEIAAIDKNLRKRNNEKDKQWHERIYKRVHNSLQRGLIE